MSDQSAKNGHLAFGWVKTHRTANPSLEILSGMGSIDSGYARDSKFVRHGATTPKENNRMALNSLFSQIVGAVTNHSNQQQQQQGGGYDTGGLLSQIQGLFGQHANNTGQDWDHQAAGNILPASQDPYGDPANQQGGQGGVLPASQDPYGDPADQR